MKLINNIFEDKAKTPKEGMRNSAKIFCMVFLIVFFCCFIIFLILFLKDWADYLNAFNNDTCAGMDPANGLGQTFASTDLQNLAKNEAIATYSELTVDANPNLIESVKATILSKYTLKNGIYYYNMLPIFEGWNYLWLFIGFLILTVIQICTLFRIEKANYTEYYTLIVLLFASFNIPSAVLLICSRKAKVER